MAVMLKEGGQHMQWYQDELLHMAKDLGLRLLPAFNTSSGLPYPRVRQTPTKQLSSASLHLQALKSVEGGEALHILVSPILFKIQGFNFK